MRTVEAIIHRCGSNYLVYQIMIISSLYPVICVSYWRSRLNRSRNGFLPDLNEMLLVARGGIRRQTTLQLLVIMG